MKNKSLDDVTMDEWTQASKKELKRIKIGDKVISFTGEVRGTVSDILDDRIILKDIAGEKLLPGCALIFELEDFVRDKNATK